MANFLILLLQLYNFLVLARVLLSYFPNVDYNNPIVRFLYEATEPVLRPIRDFLRQQFGHTPLDFSPIVLFVLILILTQVIQAFF